MKKLLFLLTFSMLIFNCSTDDTVTQETNYCELDNTNCYAIKLSNDYVPTGDEVETLLPEGTNIYTGDFVFCSLPHNTVFFSAGYYFIVDCRYE